jgi:hypothetical protein
VVENLVELGGGTPFSRSEICLAANEYRTEAGNIDDTAIIDLLAGAVGFGTRDLVELDFAFNFVAVQANQLLRAVHITR